MYCVAVTFKQENSNLIQIPYAFPISLFDGIIDVGKEESKSHLCFVVVEFEVLLAFLIFWMPVVVSTAVTSFLQYTAMLFLLMPECQ